MATGPQFTIIALKVGKMFVCDPHRKRWNYKIAKDIGADPANTHGILTEFERRGWIRGFMEHDDGSMGRAVRKLYALTAPGAEALQDLLRPLQLYSS